MKYDLLIYRQDKTPVGYMCAWGEGTDAPVVFASEPPDLQVSTSTGLTQAGGSFTARDAAPPYPIEVNNWQGGAGQKSYDHENALDSAYWSSESIDVTQEGEFGLGPRVLVFDDPTIKNACGFALGTFWAAFEPADDDPRNQLRFLARLTTTSGATNYLSTTAATALDLATYVNLDDLSLGDTTYGIAVGDILYSPSTGEVVEIASGSAGAYVVTRGEAGTTATVHAAGEQWVVLRWIPVTFAGTDPTQQVTSIGSDGEYVYAAFHTVGTDNGSIWKGKPDATDWTLFSSTGNITDLTVCAGYIYGAQDNESTAQRTTCGYFTSAGVFTPISLQGALTPRMSTAGLTSVGNYVYWGTTDGFDSLVFRLQHSSENLFELVSHLPPGFTLSDLIGHLGNLYAGGYIDTLATSVHDSDMPQYEGALYLLGADNVVLRLFRIKDASDSRIKGLAAAGPYIICLANEDTYIFDTSTGGYSHYASTPNNTIEGETEKIDWKTGGYIALPDYAHAPPRGIQYLDYGTGVLSPDTSGQDWLLFDKATDSNFDQFYDYDSQDRSYHEWQCNAKKWRRMTVVEGTVPATEVITMPATQGTIEFWVGGLRSQGGAVIVGMDNKEVRVHLHGVVTGDGTVGSHRAYLGYTDDPDCAIDKYEYKTAATGLPPGMHKYRLTFGTTGAVLYVDGVKGADVDYSQLRNAQRPNSLRFSVGWPGDPGDDSNYERIRWYGVWYTPAGIYPPDYEGGTLVTVGMSDIASAQGVSIVPVPGDSWAFIDTQSQGHSGFLEISESAFHMGSAFKYFVKVTVEHTEIRHGQSLTVIPYIDDTPVGSAQGVLNTTSTDALIGVRGTSIKVRVAIGDTDPTRPFANRLRVTSITSRFFPVNSPALHQFFLNCRKGVMCRDGKAWDYDPEHAIRYAFAAAASGEVVEVYNNFTDEGNEETQSFRIESAKLAMGPSDRRGYDRLVGTLVIRMRRVDE